MALPFAGPVEPMLAKASDRLPDGDGWLFEPKWDGFRALVFRDGDAVQLQSRELRPLDRYFPELRPPLLAALPAPAYLIILKDGTRIETAENGRIALEMLRRGFRPAILTRGYKRRDSRPALVVGERNRAPRAKPDREIPGARGSRALEARRRTNRRRS